MAGKNIDKLTNVSVKNAAPGDKAFKLYDGRGLYLEVMPTGAKYWRFKYRFGGKEKRLALGVYPETSLKEARDQTSEARRNLKQGSDPADLRRQAKLAQQLTSENSFEKVAAEWYAKERPRWSESHRTRVAWLLEKSLNPWIGSRPIGEITPPELLAALRRRESQGKLETAKRAKQVAGQVFRYAVATGRAERDPSGDLRGALATPRKKHYAAITEPKAVGQLLSAIDTFQGTPTVQAALKLSPILFCRPGELRTMEWVEINWEESRWELPAEKMKMGQPHIVPLPIQALDIFRDLQLLTGRGKYVFPSARGASRPLSENGVRTALRTMGYTNEQMTPHGFRAMARTLLDEVLGFRVEWIEHQLAHAVKDANGRAYNRTSYLKQRRDMMQRWADYLDNLKLEASSAKVVAGNFGGRV